MSRSPLPGAEQGLELIRSYATAVASQSAIRRGLFWRIPPAGLTVDAAAATLELSEVQAASLLAVLERSGLVRMEDDRVFLTSEAQSCLVDTMSEGSWRLLADLEANRMRDLATAMAPPPPSDPTSRSVIAWQPGNVEAYTTMVGELHGDLAEAVAAELASVPISRIIDVGGGAGAVSSALLRRNPGATAVVVDYPAVCAAAQRRLASQPDADRISFVAADARSLHLAPVFDLAILCDIGPIDTPLLRRVSSWLVPESRMACIDWALTDIGAPEAFDYWALTMTLSEPGYRPFSRAQLLESLEGAALDVVQETRLEPGWLLVEAAPRPPGRGSEPPRQG